MEDENLTRRLESHQFQHLFWDTRIYENLPDCVVSLLGADYEGEPSADLKSCGVIELVNAEYELGRDNENYNGMINHLLHSVVLLGNSDVEIGFSRLMCDGEIVSRLISESMARDDIEKAHGLTTMVDSLLDDGYEFSEISIQGKYFDGVVSFNYHIGYHPDYEITEDGDHIPSSKLAIYMSDFRCVHYPEFDRMRNESSIAQVYEKIAFSHFMFHKVLDFEEPCGVVRNRLDNYPWGENDKKSAWDMQKFQKTIDEFSSLPVYNGEIFNVLGR